jgi:hypothetical protein
VRDEIDINFSEPVENETVILQTEVGENNFRVAELLTVGALAKFCQLVMGFPSYGAMIGTLGLAGVGTYGPRQGQCCPFRTTCAGRTLRSLQCTLPTTKSCTSTT